MTDQEIERALLAPAAICGLSVEKSKRTTAWLLKRADSFVGTVRYKGKRFKRPWEAVRNEYGSDCFADAAGAAYFIGGRIGSIQGTFSVQLDAFGVFTEEDAKLLCEELSHCVLKRASVVLRNRGIPARAVAASVGWRGEFGTTDIKETEQ